MLTLLFPSNRYSLCLFDNQVTELKVGFNHFHQNALFTIFLCSLQNRSIKSPLH